MTLFRVWAPNASRVELWLRDADRRAMQAQEGGWWQLDAADAGPGADYAYCLDGGAPLPDPRSAWQLEGIDGPSRLVDQAAFAWQHASFRAPPLGAAVIYELHIGTFSSAGTFAGAIEKLDHLVALGVTHVELMPVAEFSGTAGWGYDGADLYAPHHAYGTPDDLKRLVDACHGRGLAVLLDVVYNHLGPAGNYLARFGPYFTDQYATPWGDAVNLDDAGSDEVRRFFIDNALMWLRDYRFDGLRLDAVQALLDRSAVHFLEELATEVEALQARTGRPLTVIAESSLNDPRLVWPRERGGYALDAFWNDDFHHPLHVLLTGEAEGYYRDFDGGTADLAKALQDGLVFDGRYSRYRGRRHGRSAAGVSPHRFVIALQTHDQVGNRARGERLVHLAGLEKAKLAAALLLLAPQVPMLFQGEEWAASTPFLYFTRHEDPELGRAVSEGRRREFESFGWQHEDVPDPQAPETFEASRLKWDEASQGEHAEMLAWYRDLIALRRSEPDLTDPRPQRLHIDFDATALWLRLRRGGIELLVNLSDADVTLPVGATSRRLLLASAPDVTLEGQTLRLAPISAAVLKDA